MANHFFREQEGDLEFVKKVRARVEEQTAAHCTFMKVVLSGMSLGSKSCPLMLLNQETGLKKLIAEFLDVPLGNEAFSASEKLENLFLAHDELEVFLEGSKSSMRKDLTMHSFAPKANKFACP